MFEVLLNTTFTASRFSLFSPLFLTYQQVGWRCARSSEVTQAGQLISYVVDVIHSIILSNQTEGRALSSKEAIHSKTGCISVGLQEVVRAFASLFGFIFLFSLLSRLPLAQPMSFCAFALSLFLLSPSILLQWQWASRLAASQGKPTTISQEKLSVQPQHRNSNNFCIYQPSLLKAAEILPFGSVLAANLPNQGSVLNFFYLV